MDNFLCVVAVNWKEAINATAQCSFQPNNMLRVWHLVHNTVWKEGEAFQYFIMFAESLRKYVVTRNWTCEHG